MKISTQFRIRPSVLFFLFSSFAFASGFSEKSKKDEASKIMEAYKSLIFPKLKSKVDVQKIKILGNAIPYKSLGASCGDFDVFSVLQSQVPLHVWESKDFDMETNGYFDGSGGTPIWIIRIPNKPGGSVKINEFFGFRVQSVRADKSKCMQVEIHVHHVKCPEGQKTPCFKWSDLN